jgi:hypothetical protein
LAVVGGGDLGVDEEEGSSSVFCHKLVFAIFYKF